MNLKQNNNKKPEETLEYQSEAGVFVCLVALQFWFFFKDIISPVSDMFGFTYNQCEYELKDEKA